MEIAILVNDENPRVLLCTIPDEQREEGEGAESDESYLESEPFHNWLKEQHGLDINQVEWMAGENIKLEDKREGNYDPTCVLCENGEEPGHEH